MIINEDESEFPTPSPCIEAIADVAFEPHSTTKSQPPPIALIQHAPN